MNLCGNYRLVDFIWFLANWNVKPFLFLEKFWFFVVVVDTGTVWLIHNYLICNKQQKTLINRSFHQSSKIWSLLMIVEKEECLLLFLIEIFFCNPKPSCIISMNTICVCIVYKIQWNFGLNFTFSKYIDIFSSFQYYD